MQIGRLDRVVDIQQYTTVANNYSSKRTKTWVDYAIGVPASKDVPDRANEGVEAMQQVSVERVKWGLRYDANYNAKMRIVYDGKYYYFIGTPREIGRSRGSMVTTELRDNE